eukprot:gene5381-5919_t
MSFSFSKKSSVKVNAVDNEKEKEKPTKKGFTKQNPILLAKTDQYVDDATLYQPQIQREHRLQHFDFLLEHWKTRRKTKTHPSTTTSPGGGHGGGSTRSGVGSQVKSWIAETIRETNDEVNYPQGWVRLFRFVRSNRWDHLYLNAWIIFLILTIIFYDGYIASALPTNLSVRALVVEWEWQSRLLSYPLYVMLASALIPCLGTAYFVHYANDLARYVAATDCQNWAFASILTAQYIEYFYYGGRGRREDASNLRPDRQGSNPRHMVNALKRVGNKAMYYVNILRKRVHATIYPGDDDDEEEEDSEDGSEEDGEGEEEGDDDVESQTHSVESKEGKKPSQLKKEKTTTSPSKPIDKQKEVSKEEEKDNKNKNKHENNNKKVKTEEEEEEEKKEEEDSLDSFELEHQGPPTETITWNCLVCNKANEESFLYGSYDVPPTKNYPATTPKAPRKVMEVDHYFGTHGVHYKRLYVKMVPKPCKPCCKKCTTPYDYKPPLATSHLFQFNPSPYEVFSHYPPRPILYHGMKNTRLERWTTALDSFLHGLNNSYQSRPLMNDWRLKKWIKDKFPPIPRYQLQPNEKFELGELVECKSQRSEYCRARIVNVRPISYDIRYDTGDEVRFVAGSELRLSAEKGAFAYRVEIGLVGLYIGFPLGLVLAILMVNPGMTFLAPLIVGGVLFLIRLDNFLNYAYNFIEGGLYVILRSTMFFSLPLLFLFLTGIVGLVSLTSIKESSFGVVILLLLTLISSIPVIYIIRPHYGLLALVIFLQICTSVVLLAIQWQSEGKAFLSLGIPLAPFFTATFCLKYLRIHLNSIWDVSLVIRPALPFQRSLKNVWWAMLDKVRRTIIYYLP